MRRLAIPIAAAIALSGLTVVATPHEAAQAIDLATQPSESNCFTTNPFGRSAALAQRNAFSLEVRRGDKIDFARGIASPNGTQQGNGILPVYPPNTVTGGAALAASTSAQLTGDGPESIVRLYGTKGTVPVLDIDSYTAGEPSQASLYSRIVTGSGLTQADAVAVAAADFEPTSTSDWLAQDLNAEPEEVAVAWRSPTDDASPEKISVQLYRTSTDQFGTALEPYGTPYSISNEFVERPALTQNVLAMTTADLDLDGDPEIVLAYQWGNEWDDVRVAALTVSNPDDPTLALAANVSVPLQRQFVPQISVGAGFFGEHATSIVLGWQENSGPGDTRAPARLETLSLPHAPGQQPPQLTPPDPSVPGHPVVLESRASRTFTTETSDAWKTPAFAVGVGDVDTKGAATVGQSFFEADRDEIVVARTDGPNLWTSVLNATDLTTKVEISDSGITGTNAPRGVTIGVGDMDLDTDGDILAAYSNSAGEYRLMWLAESVDRSQLVFKVAMPTSLSPAGGNPLPIVMSDVGDETVRMAQRRDSIGSACRDISTDMVLSAADPAPFWQNASHLGWWGYTDMGGSRDGSVSKEDTVSQVWSQSRTWTGGIDLDPIPFLKAIELEANVEYEEAWETSAAKSTGVTDSFSTAQGFFNASQDTWAQWATVTYRCFYYEITAPTSSSSMHSRSCIPINATNLRTLPFDPVKWYGEANNDITLFKGDSNNWEADQSRSSDFGWAPFRPEWTSLTATLPPSAASQSDGGGAAGNAIDGFKNAADPSTVAATAVTADPWWQVKLDTSEDVGLVRVYPGAAYTCAANPCRDLLQDFDVYVFDNDSLENGSSAQLQSAGIVPFHVSASPAKVSNIVTLRGASQAAATGQFVRVQMRSPDASLQLAEVEVYAASDAQLPPAYPSAVKAATAQELQRAGESGFIATLWDTERQRYVDRFIAGELMPINPAPAWTGVTAGACDGMQTGSWSRSNSTETTFSQSDSYTQGVGGSTELTFGPEVFKGKLGLAETWTSGVENSSSRVASVGKSFSIGWGRGNYCYRTANDTYDTRYSTSDHCSYRFKPFYFVEEEWANSGYVQKFPHVSYVVDTVDSTTGVDRRRTDLTDCLQDHWRYGANVAPSAPNVTIDAGNSGALIHIHPLAGATDANPEDVGYLAVRGVAKDATTAPTTSATTNGGGYAWVDSSGTVTYEPPSWAWTSDTFYVTITDHAADSAPIKVTVKKTGISNGDFNGTLNAWTTSGQVGLVSSGGYSGGPYARLTVPATGGTATLSQLFAVPSSGTDKLVVYRRGSTNEDPGSPPRDTLQIRMTSGSTSRVLAAISNQDVNAIWTRYEYDVSDFKEMLVELKFTANGASDGSQTTFGLDAVSISATDHWVARVNAGGTSLPATDNGPDWDPDTDSQPSSTHNANSIAKDWGNLSITRGANLPASTPTAVFSTERWSPNDSPNMQWNFLAPAGHNLTVRLFFSNGFSGTSQPGQRKFDVVVDGTTVLNDYDIVADVGNQVGTMKSFNITSDGNVDIDFAHVLENPLINGIEIIDNDVPVP
jgi:Malectin domain